MPLPRRRGTAWSDGGKTGRPAAARGTCDAAKHDARTAGLCRNAADACDGARASHRRESTAHLRVFIAVLLCGHVSAAATPAKTAACVRIRLAKWPTDYEAVCAVRAPSIIVMEQGR
eukprot:6178892-Pleurochrysis_carterae.AAC.4